MGIPFRQGLAAGLAAVAFHAAAADPIAGVRHMVAPSEERGGDLEVTVWYPAELGGEPVVLGESVFFQGTAAAQDAPIRDGAFPLIVLSHGAGLAGRAEAMAWIAAPLAREGFIVAAPTHPGNTGPDRSAEETMRLWRRASDLSDTLDAMESSSVFQRHIASGGPGVLGLSMGGGTALMLGGARIDPDLYAGYCDAAERNASLCQWVRMSGVDLRAMDRAVVGASYADSRIRFAMALDPAPADILARESLADIAIPVALVNLGRPDDIPTTVLASGIADTIPSASYRVIEDASHASMFALCQPAAAEIAREEGIEDPICSDGGGRARQAIHAQLVTLVADAFREALVPGG